MVEPESRGVDSDTLGLFLLAGTGIVFTLHISFGG